MKFPLCNHGHYAESCRLCAADKLRDKFDSKDAEIESLKASLKIATDALKHIGTDSWTVRQCCEEAIDMDCDGDHYAEVAVEALAKITGTETVKGA